MALKYLVVSREGGDRNRVFHGAFYFCYIPIADESRLVSSTKVCAIEVVELWVLLSGIFCRFSFPRWLHPASVERTILENKGIQPCLFLTCRRIIRWQGIDHDCVEDMDPDETQ